MISILSGSCSFPHYYYIPNVQNVPLFKQSNEFSGLAAFSTGIIDNCAELQAGYSLTDHVALIANFMTGGNNNSTQTYEDFSKINYFEGALGYYKSFSDIGVFEVYGGYGQGSQHHAFSYSEFSNWYTWTTVSDGKADMSFSKIFIQPNIGIKIKWVESAFSCRFTRLNFNDIVYYGTTYHLDELNLLQQNSTPWFIEPAITFRAGFEPVKFQLQLVFSQNLVNPELLFEKFRINLGLQFNISKKRSESNTQLTYRDR